MKGPGVGKDSSEQRAKSEEGKMSASTPQSEPPPLNESLPPASKEDESSLTSTETQVGFAERCRSVCCARWDKTQEILSSNSHILCNKKYSKTIFKEHVRPQQ